MPQAGVRRETIGVLLENEVITPKNARWYSVFGLPVLMCVEYISALKVATSYKFLFIVFLSIKYSATVGFLPVTLLLLLVLLNVFNFSWLLDVFA
ncbi:hypothetical protein LNO18_20420 [Klebsiella variicola subsp. variicola]|nr:hypothetical protein [Klebsiella variicola subsp. variicola]